MYLTKVQNLYRCKTPLAARDISAAQVKGDDSSSGTSAIAQTTAIMQDLCKQHLISFSLAYETCMTARNQ